MFPSPRHLPCWTRKGIVRPVKTIGSHVHAAFYALLALVGLSPLLSFFDRLWADGIVELYVAVTLGIVAVFIRPGEAAFWVKTTRWAIILAAVPLLWMIVQLLPLPIGSISGSIWQSAGSALGTNLWSSITIDPGLTILALCRYASIIAVGIIAAAVSIDRLQAERLFFVLGFAVVVLALLSVVHQLGGFAFLGDRGSDSIRAATLTGSVYGVVLFAALAILIVERHLTRRSQHDFRWQFLMPLAGSIGGFAFCCLATLIAGSEQTIFAAGCGLATVVIIQFVRRIGLDWRAAAAMGCVAIIGAAVIVATKGHPALADFSMRYATHTTADFISVSDRLVHGVGFAGSGAGTFEAIYRLYAVQDISGATLAPTLAAQIAIELGRPALWIMTMLMVALIFLCARGGFNRGRDFFYSIGGAGVGVASLVLAFCDIGMSNLVISMLLAASLGLALAQSLSRTL